jgi:hypothetical protein
MYRFLAFAFAVLISSAVQADEIPLKEIWAYNMPGTHPLVDGLSPEKSPQALPLGDIRRALSSRRDLKDAGHGFAVEGVGLDALRNAQQVMIGNEEPAKTISITDGVSIVFFSRQFGAYIHIKKVTVKGNDICIYYQFVPHVTKNLTEHFALIPVTSLEPGKVNVNMRRLPDKSWEGTEYEQFSNEIDQRIVCRPFSFKVK